MTGKRKMWLTAVLGAVLLVILSGCREDAFSPAGCNELCSRDELCDSGFCSNGACRDPDCPDDPDCDCSVAGTCSDPCDHDEGCDWGLVCADGACRDPDCPDEEDCECPATCGEPCSDIVRCEEGLVCTDGACANSDCPDEEDCECSATCGEPSLEAEGVIQPGETVRATLPPGGEAVWTFVAAAGECATIRLEAVDGQGFDPYLELRDDLGHSIAEDDDGWYDLNPRLAEICLANDGWYCVLASAFEGSGDYDLTLELADGPSGGGEIRVGETVTGVLPDGVWHGWHFGAHSGDAITIAMNALDDQLDCYVVLYGPDGQYLDDDDDGGEGFNSLLANVELDRNGFYTIWVTDATGGGGSYELLLE